MGTPFQSQNPWLGAAQVGDSLGNAFYQTAIGLPRARLEADMMRSQMARQQQEGQIAAQQAPLHSALLQAQAQAEQARALSELGQQQHWQAQAGLANQQTQDLQVGQREQFELGKIGGEFVKQALETGKADPQVASTFAAALARQHKIDPNFMSSVVQMMGLSNSGIGGTNQGLNAAAATGTPTPMRMNVPPGNTSIQTINPTNAPYVSPVPTAASANRIGNIVPALLQAGQPGNPLYIGGTNTPQARLEFLINAGKQLQEGLNTQPGQSNQIPTVTNKAQFDALPSGAVYLGTNGTKYRKP